MKWYSAGGWAVQMNSGIVGSTGHTLPARQGWFWQQNSEGRYVDALRLVDEENRGQML
ncbi:hypothetical protein JS561_18950 [Salmonella enterica subsp. enterica serovar Infantis]|nr:hypothetical protein JS561_18950 [Salmonella enterica subsp. enterica serovar Infantis]